VVQRNPTKLANPRIEKEEEKEATAVVKVFSVGAVLGARTTSVPASIFHLTKG
jgi:hypothetical protein